MIEIYRLSFWDGTQYVGQSRNVKKRLLDHFKSPSNAELHMHLLSDLHYKLEILSRHRKQEVADREERKQIDRLAFPLNRILGNGQFRKSCAPRLARSEPFAALKPSTKAKHAKAKLARRYKARDKGTPVGPGCREEKDVSEFYRDACRSSGRASRCKICSTFRQQKIQQAIKEGRGSSAGYYEAKAACKAQGMTR
ncbi:MAG: GIY-YIG nuclease family protein [Gammaproteobacteria bacterium]|nr:GIY-YIG nuclease family protein [Gammaproteobacteria bacterium]